MREKIDAGLLRLEFLEKKYLAVRKTAYRDLAAFEKFLVKLSRG